MADSVPYPGTPRWVKVCGVLVIVLGLVFVMLLVFGADHGPGRHTRSGGGGGHATPLEQGGR